MNKLEKNTYAKGRSILKNKLIVISLLIILSLTAFQYWTILQVQSTLPSDQWSRSFQVKSPVSNYNNLQSVKEEDSYTVSLRDLKKLIILSCDMDMSCEKNRTIDSLDSFTNTWSDQSNSFYIKDKTLIHSTISNGDTEIAQDVVNFSKDEDTLVYWKEDQNVIVSNSPFTTVKQQFTMDEPVNFVTILEDQMFIVTENKKEHLFTVYSNTNQLSKLFEFHVNGSEILSSMHIMQTPDKSYSFLLDTEILSGGKRTKTILAAPFNLSTNQSPTFSNLKFLEEDTGMQLTEIRFPSVYQTKEEALLTFSATVRTPTGERVNKIFVGSFLDNTIHASAVTKAGDRFERPTLLNEQTVAYLKLEGANRSLLYSSSDEVKKEESNGIMEGDYEEASYTLLSMLFNGFILVLFSFIWIVLSLGITYGLLVLMERWRFAHSHKTAFLVHIIALFGIQTYFIYQFTTIENLVYNIPFITETWHFVILLFIASILSTIPLLLARYKVNEDTFNVIVLYTTCMNTTVLFFLVGPYLF